MQMKQAVRTLAPTTGREVSGAQLQSQAVWSSLGVDACAV